MSDCVRCKEPMHDLGGNTPHPHMRDHCTGCVEAVLRERHEEAMCALSGSLAEWNRFHGGPDAPGILLELIANAKAAVVAWDELEGEGAI